MYVEQMHKIFNPLKGWHLGFDAYNRMLRTDLNITLMRVKYLESSLDYLLPKEVLILFHVLQSIFVYCLLHINVFCFFYTCYHALQRVSTTFVLEECPAFIHYKIFVRMISVG